MFNVKDLYEGTMASVGIVQGLYQSFLVENKGDEEIAIKLTEIAWNGLMLAAKPDNEKH